MNHHGSQSRMVIGKFTIAMSLGRAMLAMNVGRAKVFDAIDGNDDVVVPILVVFDHTAVRQQSEQAAKEVAQRRGRDLVQYLAHLRIGSNLADLINAPQIAFLVLSLLFE
jgi:hypothetical protein